ncbi:glycosyl hydrolase family 28-related protein [Rhodopseudomonas sp. NSM]|uniref:glycosyl hydrolase family 28-related protein n=1 Tax=Rhodopseudomonas sp. NSM TaxID=3457630 RepID=UPI004036F35B
MWRRLLLTIALLVCNGAAAAAPAIFWFNDPVGPDQTVLVTGAGLAEVTDVTVARIPDRGSAAAAPKSVAILQQSAQSLKFVVPPEFSPGLFEFELSAPEGKVSGRANLPTVYWVQGDLGTAASPGGHLQIFGRNIVRRQDHARLDLIADAGGAVISMRPGNGDLWQARFAIPAEARPGSYRLRLSNGDGGDLETVDVGAIEIRARKPAPEQSFDIRAFGGNGDGRADNTAAVARALAAAAQAGGGTVYFPRGRYFVRDTIVVPPDVTLRGEATQAVNLVWPDVADPPDALISGTTRFAVEDLTIYASNHRHIIVGGFVDGKPAKDATDITIRRVRIRASAYRGLIDPAATHRRMQEIERLFPSTGPHSLRLSGRRIAVLDNDILGSGSSLLLFEASDAVISGNLLANGRYGWYSITGSNRVIFRDNLVRASDLQGAGGGINTLFSTLNGSENVFIGHNRFEGLYGLDREAVTADGPGGLYFGAASSIDPQLLRLNYEAAPVPARPNWEGAAVMVVAGRGVGQTARVATLERSPVPSERRLRLDRPLQVPLDQSSVVNVTLARENFLIVGNRFEDCGVAAQSYGTGLNHVIAGNVSTRTGGFFAIGLVYAHFQPGWQIQLLDNRIVEGNIYRAGTSRTVLSEESAIGVHAYRIGPGASEPPLARAIIMRGNRLEQDAHLEIKSSPSPHPGVRDVVIEDNIVGPSRIGIHIDSGAASILQRNNAIERKIAR